LKSAIVRVCEVTQERAGTVVGSFDV